MTTTTTKSLLLFCFAFLGHFIGLISAIVETPWNYGTLDIEKAKASGRRRLVALNDNSAPSVLSAILSSDGSFLIVTLSQPTNKGGYSTIFPCENYFTFTAVERATCEWSDAETIKISPDLSPTYVDSAFTIGSLIMLNGNSGTVSATCAASSSLASCPSLGPQTLWVLGPTDPVTPQVFIQTSPSISACLPWTLSLTSSRGDGGRGWTSKVIEVTGVNGPATALQTYLQSVLTTSSPITVPSSYLTVGETYTVTVTLTTIFGKTGTKTATVVVNSGSSSAPSIELVGLPASYYSSDILAITARAAVKSCNGGTTSAGLTYQWSVTGSNAETVKFTNPRVNQLSVASNGLIPGVTYAISVTVTDSSSQLSNTASVSISVSKSPLVAKISPSTNQLFRVDASNKLTLSGFHSSDPDDPRNEIEPLTYSWSCATKGQTDCAFTVDRLNSMDITITGDDSSMIGTVSTFTLTVTKDTRSASTMVSVTAIPGTAPVINITTPVTALQQIDTTKRALIQGSVSASSSVSCVWSTNGGSDFDLSKSTSPLTRTIPVGTSLYPLFLPANLLPVRATYQFTLNCATSSATVTVTTNGPPVPGSLSVSPTSGIEMTDLFTFTALSWTDPDLPITYRFGFISPSTALTSPVGSLSTLSYSSSKLPAGAATSNNVVQATVDVFDRYGASTQSSTSVTVSPIPADQRSSKITSQLQASKDSTNLDDLKSVISVASSVVSRVDCTVATACSSLNRAACKATANTCGVCLEGYVGQSGDSNSPCVSKDSAGGSTSIQQTCPGDCSGHGVCRFIDQTGLTITSCPITAGLACTPECVCDNGYAGNDCSMSSADLADDQSLRSTLLSSVSYLVSSEETTADSVTTVVSSVSGIVQSSSNVNEEGIVTFNSIATTTLSNSLSDSSITANDLSGFLGPLDAAITANAAITRRRRKLTVTSTNGKPATIAADNSIKFGHDILSAFADVVSRDSEPGVPTTSYTFGNFRMAQQAIAGSSGSLAIPLTEIEQATGQVASSISVDTKDSEDVNLLLTQYSAALLSTNDKYSNIVSGKFSAGSTITLELANIAGDTGPAVVKPENFTSRCEVNDRSQKTYTCPGSGVVLRHTCSGIAGELTSYCPVLKTVCSNVDLGSSVGDYSCSVQSITEAKITCKCSFSRRRLDSSGIEGGIMNMVAMTQFVGNEAEQTFKAAPALTSPEAIERSLIVIIMYCVLWISGLLMLAGCIYRQRRMKEIRLEQRLERMQTVDRDSRTSSLEDVREKLIHYVQAVFPIIFYSEHWLVRLKDEIRRNHSYMMLFNSVDGDLEDKKRIINGLKLLTTQTALMFLLALLYDLQGPVDNGTCESYTTEESCLSQKSVLDDTQYYCNWSLDDPSQPCTFNNSGVSFKASLYIQVIVSVFTAFLMRPLEYGFNILLAPSIDQMKQKLEEEKRIQSITAGRPIPEAERTETKRTSLSMLFSSPEEDPEIAELTRVLVTLIPDDVENVSQQAKSYFKKINNMETPTAPLLSTKSEDSSPQNNSRRSLISKVRTSIAIVANKVLNTSEEETVQILFNELSEKIKIERSSLSGEELEDFDCNWGLDGEGNFLRNDLHIKGKKDVSEIIRKEVAKVEHEANEDIKRLKLAIDHHIGLEILHKFILDVLGRDTPAGFIFAGKTEEDFRKSPVRSFRLKVFVAALLICANCLFVYYSVLRGYIQGVEWQKQYLVACIIQMVLEIYLFETFECIWINVCIPSLVASEVQRVNRLLLGIIDDICEKAVTGEKLQVSDTGHVLDTPQYLFMSTRIANAFPTLMESMIVRTYHTHLPGEMSYKWLATDHSFAAYYRRWMGRAHTSDTTLLVASVGAMLATIQIIAFVPFDAQRMMVRFFQPFLFGGLVLLWQRIVQSTMGIIIAVVAITVVVVLVVWHYHSHLQASDYVNEAKISPDVDDIMTMKKKSSDGHIAMQKVKSVRVAGARNESSYNSNEMTENQSVESIRAASRVDEEDTVDRLHYPVHAHPHSPKKTKKSPSKKSSGAHVYQSAAVTSSRDEVDLDVLIDEFKNNHDSDSDDGSYRFSLSDTDDKE